MHPNKGQWHENIAYKLDLALGELYLENNGLLFNLSNAKQHFSHHHDHAYDHSDETYRSHVIRSVFLGAVEPSEIIESDSSSFYRNYVLGNDKGKWKSSIYSAASVKMREVYPGIDVRYETKTGNLKYSFDVASNADPTKIRIQWEGQNKIFIDDEGRLHVVNEFGDIIEDKPIAWTIDENGKIKKVDVAFHLQNNIVSFKLGSYDHSAKLIIDPSLTFSTFTGATADNWGMSATPDENANLFGGGVVFAQGYPITTGAYDDTFNGGTVDISITKFNEDGTSLIYSTYLGGGTGSETPNSIVCAPNGELYIFGVTSSSDFPMAGTPYDNTFDAGPSLPNAETNNLGFTAGSDIIVARLNATGTALLSSTYIGGTGTDGLNTSNLKFNYGDQLRGEIILDDADNVYIASMTGSADFPTVNATQPVISGVQDAVVFKLDPTLSTMLWSTYLGGTGLETGNSVQISNGGDVFVAGGTDSGVMPFGVGEDLTFNGGLADGYVAKFDSNTGAIIAGSFLGLGEYDQAYFVQLDIDDNVYVLGQTESDWAITAGLYGNPNSGQFIRKYTNDLLTIEWTTMIGAGTGHVEISPTAFLVSECYDIYLSGWGGQLNANAGVSQAVNSTSNGFPVTSGPNNMAHQLTTNGSNFYIAVLAPDASYLKYGTYMGGTSSPYNHVDGGTSRFDKAGRIYHAVCGSCGSTVTTGFTTTPGVWSETSNSPNCNMACFKFELAQIEALAADPDPYVCLPNPVEFINNSVNGNFFYWDFGDGDTSNMENASHVYPGPGTYLVTLVVSDTVGCFSSDSSQFYVNIGDFQAQVDAVSGSICPGDSYQLNANGGSSYYWSPGQFLDDSTLANPTATLYQTTDFTVFVSDTCGTDTIMVTIPVFDDDSSISADTSVCIGNNAFLSATGGGTYSWSPSTYLNNSNIANPISTPDQNITYDLEIISPDGCVFNESVTVDVFYDPPQPVMPDSVYVCEGTSTIIQVSGGDSYYWTPNLNINTQTGSSVVITPQNSTLYYCEFTNACGFALDSVYVDVINAQINAFNDTIICPGDGAQLSAAGGVSYIWTPSNTLSSSNTSAVYATPNVPTIYTVSGIDQNGCWGSDSVFVDLHPMPFIQTNGPVYAIQGEQVQLTSVTTTNGPVTWYPVEFLSCVVCDDPLANPDQNFTYVASYTDENGCFAADTVNIIYDPIVYIPNTFTPDGNEFNQTFKAIVRNSTAFKMEIYNRWGELIYTVESLEDFWDGTYEGIICQDGTYTWKAIVTDLNEVNHIYVGHVNLLR
jgi:gliding motility-associated-like protein